MQYLQVITSNTKSKFKGQTPFSILPQQSLIMAAKSVSHRMSDWMLMITRLTSLSWVMDVRRRLSISLSLEKERSVIQLVTITTKYILTVIATLGKVSCMPLSIISLYKNSSVLISPGSSSLNIFIEYATSAGHHKNMYTHRNEKKRHKTLWKKAYTHKNTIKSKA